LQHGSPERRRRFYRLFWRTRSAAPGKRSISILRRVRSIFDISRAACRETKLTDKMPAAGVSFQREGKSGPVGNFFFAERTETDQFGNRLQHFRRYRFRIRSWSLGNRISLYGHAFLHGRILYRKAFNICARDTDRKSGRDGEAARRTGQAKGSELFECQQTEPGFPLSIL